jgi:hypothetical protein
VVQIWPGLFVCKQVTVCPGHIWTTLNLYCKRRSCLLLARVCAVATSTYCIRSCPSVCPSILVLAQLASSTVRNSVKFDAGDFHENLSRNSKFVKVSGCLLDCLKQFYCCRRHRQFTKAFLCNNQHFQVADIFFTFPIATVVKGMSHSIIVKLCVYYLPALVLKTIKVILT